MSFQLLNRTVFPFKNVLALKHIFCHNATMIYKFDSFWSYIGDEPDYVLTQVKDILTCHDYNYTTEQYTDVKFWLTHTNILGQEVLKFPTGLCEYVAQKTGCQIEHKKTQYDAYTDHDVLQIAQKVQKLFPGFEVRDYQKDLTLASVDKYSSMIVASVGSGKTSVMSMLVMLWKDKRILITNNQNFILKQIYDRLLAMGVPLDEIATGTTDLTKRIVIISTQTSYNRIKDKNQEFLDYLQGVEVIINDECQHYQSVSNFSMLFYTPNLQHLVGYTGSPFRNPNKPYSNATDMTTIALFGEPAITYSMEDSIENQNIATPYSYFINYDCYKMEYMAGTDFFVQYNRSIVYNKQRNKAGIEILRFLHNNGIKTLGLFRIVKKHGLVVLKELKKYGVKALFLQGGETIYECDSKLKITSRKGGIDEIKKALHEDGYNIILASQVMDEGVDISSFQCGVLFTGGKSAIKIVQQTGRVSRAKSNGENISLVIDFNDTPINRMFANQYKERKKTLKQNGVIELQNLQEVIDIVNRMKA